MDPIVCPLMNLVTMIEVVGTDGDFLFGRSNKSAAQQLKLVYTSEFFTSQRTGQVGTHSVRKGSATFASRSGCHKDWINQRGRWRGGKQQVDTYIDSYQPYPDARVASVLCGPRGPCKYVIKDDVVMPAGFLESITPNSQEVFGSDIAEVLALPLLWAAFERESPCKGISQLIIPSLLADSSRERWVAAGGIVDVNPIEKIKLAVEQNVDQLILIPLIPNEGEDSAHQEGRQVAGVTAGAGIRSGEILVLQVVSFCTWFCYCRILGRTKRRKTRSTIVFPHAPHLKHKDALYSHPVVDDHDLIYFPHRCSPVFTFGGPVLLSLV